MLTVPLLALAALLVVDRAACAEWKYSGEFGPHNWAAVDTSPNINQCGGKFQSPVDFDDRYSEFDPSLGEIRYSGYNEELYNPYIVNNGHTVQVSATENENRYIEGAGLPGRFQFAQFHYHWGSNSSRGAEHTVRGFQYPLELHLVHFNQKYGSLAESLKYNDGLAVLGVFFEVGPTANEDISVIVDALKDVRLSGTRGTNLQRPVVLSRLLPRRTKDFFRYTGSLTTPPCSEVVTFTIFTTTVPISEEQLQQFRLLRTGSDEASPPLVNNFRPTFPLNGRRVFRSFSSSATRPGVGPEGFPSKPNRKPSGNRRGGSRNPEGRPQVPSRPRGPSRPRDTPRHDRDFPRNDGRPSRPRDIPRADDGISRPGDSPRRDGGSSRPRDFPRHGHGSSRREGFPRRDGGSSRPRDFPRDGDESSRPEGFPRRDGVFSRPGDFPINGDGFSRPSDFPRRDDGFSSPRGSSRREGGSSRPRGFSPEDDDYLPPQDLPRNEGPSRPRNPSRPADSHRNRGSSGRSPQREFPRPHDTSDQRDSPNRRGQFGSPDYPAGLPRELSGLPEFPYLQSGPTPDGFAAASQHQTPRGPSPTQGIRDPEQFAGPQQHGLRSPQGFPGGSQEPSLPLQGSRPQGLSPAHGFPLDPGAGSIGLLGPGRG
ncbi:uncharacterized protein LOC144145928 isoform X2 [Haemaphysalis longicornis]